MTLPKDTESLGATPLWKDHGVRGSQFAFFVREGATRVELCLFDEAREGGHETDHIDLKRSPLPTISEDGVKGYIWRGFAPGVIEGKYYGYRAHGPGFNPNKLLLEPAPHDESDIIKPGDVRHDSSNHFNNGDIAPKARVVNWRTLPAGHTRYLGATLSPDKTGTNFAFYTSKDATGVELCLFDQAAGAVETSRIEFRAKEEVKGDNGELIGYIWNGYAEGVGEGQLYGMRVFGPYNPDKGQFFNPHKLLIDPCAKAVTGEIDSWDQRHFHNDFCKKINNRADISTHDNAEIIPKARVVDWQLLQARATEGLRGGALYPHADTIIAEMHVERDTQLPEIPKNERGTFRALASEPFIHWVKKTGITTLELLPIESYGTDSPLADRGRLNGFGYMTNVPTAPHTGYACDKSHPEEEVAQTIRTLKKNKIEVVMDVVPNHTLESGWYGPLLNLRGMDNTLYLSGEDYTGVGNTRDFSHPINRRMFMEELEYWRGMGVAGFRIDLAAVLGSDGANYFNSDSTILKQLRQDPGYENALRDVKLYGEPWHIKGQFKGQFARGKKKNGNFNPVVEWNPDARDHLQQLLKPHSHVTRGQLADIISGSQNVYPEHGTQSGVNYIVSHDGFTLRDFTSYNDKHNEANGEDNRDGSSERGNNWGAEGATDNVVINANRARVQRFGLAMLALSQGVPMIRVADAIGHSQQGNNNAYCRNDAITHADWQGKLKGHELSEFVAKLMHFRRNHTSLRRATHFPAATDANSDYRFEGNNLKYVTWLNEDGKEIPPADPQWNEVGGFTIMLSGDPGNSPPDYSSTRRVERRERDTPLLIAVNPTMHEVNFTLPNVPGIVWKPAINSMTPKQIDGEPAKSGDTIKLGFRSLIAFEGQRELQKSIGAKVSSDRMGAFSL